MKGKRSWTWILVLSVGSAQAAVSNLADQLSGLRNQVSSLEQSLLDGAQNSRNAKVQIRKIQKLIQLQKQERKLGQDRMSEIEKTIQELEDRRLILKSKISQQQKQLRSFLQTIESSQRTQTVQMNEKIQSPRRKVLANLVAQGLKDLQVLKTDLEDSDKLGVKIQDEKEQMVFLFQDLKEQASVLELNRQLQFDLIRRKSKERMSQLENYRRLKTAEAQVEGLIRQFNTRKELQRTREAEREVSKAMLSGEFGKLKGKLPYPVEGFRLVGGFGKAFDAKSGLYVFKKGIDLATQFGETVKAISQGKVAFAGELPGYGQVVLLDHGDHFYSLYGHLGRVVRKNNDSVKRGETLGLTGDSTTPLYFEIRSRNVAVNPLQWLLN